MAKGKARAKARKPASRKPKPRRPASKKKTRKAARSRRAVKPAKRAAARSKRPGVRRSTSSGRPKPVALQRERRRLRDEDVAPSVPSTFNFSPKASSAESGRASTKQHRRDHPQSGHDLTAGDMDTDWEEAYSDGDEAPGGDNPTPDQDVVEEIGRALGVEYDDAEELKGADKIIERDRHRWEYDPASADDYRDRNKKE